MSKRIGMLSFHESLSYGATLQCFALQKVVERMGYSPEFIDFRRKKCTQASKGTTRGSAKERLKRTAIRFAQKSESIIRKENDLRVVEAFARFKQENLRVGGKTYNSVSSLYEDNDYYDAYITGSDQVWNPFNSILEVYGLGFVPERINTVAYAASIGVAKIPESKREYMYRSLKNVRHVSCREYEGATALSGLLGREVTNVLDPTLLLSKEEWSTCEAASELPERFVLSFFLGSLDYPRKAAARLARKNGCKLIVIPGSPRDLLTSGRIAKGCGPREFLELFRKAAFICTDSFHGTAFAVNLNKPFYAFCRRGYDEATSYLSRIKDLLDLVGLPERLIYPERAADVSFDPIDYESVNRVLEKERGKSLAFLARALKDQSV